MRRDVTAHAVKQENKGQIPPVFTFCSVQALKRLDDARPHRGGQFTESADSHANLIQRHPHRHTQK